MSAPFRVRDLASIMGGWPFLRGSDGSAEGQLISGALAPSARIVGTVQEPTDGFFLLDGKSFLLYVDSDPNSPFTVTFSDPGSSGLTCDDLVTQVNTTTTPGPLPADVAFNENNFLVLKSPTEGEGSYLKVASVSGSEDVFRRIGLFSETESWGGELAQSPHMDPDRQVAMPGQSAMMWGESFSANTFNRLAMQMAIQSDRSVGTLERQRAAFFKRKARAVSDIVTGTGGDQFVRLITTPGPGDEEWIYMGPYALGDPELDVELAVAIVDADGNEITKEAETVLDSTAVDTDMTFTWDDARGVQTIVDAGSPSVFAGAYGVYDDYARVTGLTGSASTLNGRLLKISRKVSSSTVEVQPLDNLGTVVPITDANKTPGGMTLEAVRVTTKKVKIDSFCTDADWTTVMTGIPINKVTGAPIQRVELNNRIVTGFAGFTSAPNPTVVGDVVTLANHTETVPHNNNGTYRVSKVIDDYTIEVVGEDWGPVYLNSKAAVSLGDVTVKSDGKFYDNPYLKFEDKTIIPDGDFYILYQKMSTIRDALQEDPAALLSPAKYLQEAAHNTTKAILGIVGPSVDTLDDVINWLYVDRRFNMEDLYAQLGNEHHDHQSGEGGGRHSTIHPDVVDMYPEVAGETVIIRATTNAFDDLTNPKVSLYDQNEVRALGIWKDGHIGIGDYASSNNSVVQLFIQDTAKDARAYLGSYPGYDCDLTLYSTYYKVFIEASNNSGFARVQWDHNAASSSFDIRYASDVATFTRGGVEDYLKVDGTTVELVSCQNLVPETDEGELLGTSTRKWAEAHAVEAYLSRVTLDYGSASTGVNSNLYPSVDSAYQLGSYSYKWNRIYIAQDFRIEDPGPLFGGISYSAESLEVFKWYNEVAADIYNAGFKAVFLGSPASASRTNVYAETMWSGVLGSALDDLYGFDHRFGFLSYATLDVTRGYGYHSRGDFAGTKKVGSFHHFYAKGVTGAASNIDNQYGLYVEELSLASGDNWAIYTAGSTPSYFGGQITVDGPTVLNGFTYIWDNLYVDLGAVITGDASIKGGDLSVLDGSTLLGKISSSGSDGTLILKDDAATVEMTGTDLYYAREWAQMNKNYNYIIQGLALEKDWGHPYGTPNWYERKVRLQAGIWYANGEIHAQTSELTGVDLELASSWIDNAAHSGWAFMFIHPTDGLKASQYHPDTNGGNYGGNAVSSEETIYTSYDQNEQNWTYVGAVYYDGTANEVQPRVCIGDQVLYGGRSYAWSTTDLSGAATAQWPMANVVPVGAGTLTSVAGFLNVEARVRAIATSGTPFVVFKVYHHGQITEYAEALQMRLDPSTTHYASQTANLWLAVRRNSGNFEAHVDATVSGALGSEIILTARGYVDSALGRPGTNRYLY